MKNNYRYIGLIITTLLLYLVSIFYRIDELTMTPFRESQTGISAFYLMGNLSWQSIVNYQTPVVGYPWQIPFEFPLYQMSVALLARGNEVKDIVFAGKLISLLYFTAFVVVSFKLLDMLGVGRGRAAIMSLVLISSPVYVGYSPVVMIESMALLAGVSHLLCFLKYIKSGNILYLIIGLLFSIMAILVKSTTWVFFAIIFMLSSLYYIYIEINKINLIKKIISRILISFVIMIVVPLVVGVIWINHTDEVKLSIYLAEGLSSGRLKEWNYGSLSQRLDPIFWMAILSKMVFISFGFGILIYFYKLKGVISKSYLKEEGGVLIVPLASVFLIIILFPNLYFRHDYYFYAISWALLIAVGWMLTSGNINKNLIIVFIILSQAGSGFYLLVKKNYYVPSDIATIKVLKDYKLNGPVIILNNGFSSYVPFFVQSKALMSADVKNFDIEKSYFKENKKIEWDAIIYKKDTKEDAMTIIERFGLQYPYSLNFFGDYWIAGKKEMVLNKVMFDGELQIHINNFKKIIDLGGINSGFIKYFNISIDENKIFPSIVLILGRDADMFYIDILNPVIIRF
jgi:hypothetical protein